MSSTAADLRVVAEGTPWGEGVRGYSGVPSSAPAPSQKSKKGQWAQRHRLAHSWNPLEHHELWASVSSWSNEGQDGWSLMSSAALTTVQVLDGTLGKKDGRKAPGRRASLGLYSGRGQTLPT